MVDGVKTVTPTSGTTLTLAPACTRSGPERWRGCRQTMPTTWLGRKWWSTSLRPHPLLRGEAVADHLDRYVLQPCMATWGRSVTY
jgi:hypothetical protein